jgi:hypothetical protein
MDRAALVALAAALVIASGIGSGIAGYVVGQNSGHSSGYSSGYNDGLATGQSTTLMQGGAWVDLAPGAQLAINLNPPADSGIFSATLDFSFTVYPEYHAPPGNYTAELVVFQQITLYSTGWVNASSLPFAQFQINAGSDYSEYVMITSNATNPGVALFFANSPMVIFWSAA